MIERLRPECISCLLKSHLEKYPTDASPDEKLKYMQNVLKVAAEAKKSDSAPVLVNKINVIQREMFGYEEDFAEKKLHYNSLMLEMEADIGQKIREAEDPLKLALQYAMTGNYIDFGTHNDVTETELNALLNQATSNPVNNMEYQSLKKDLQDAENIVYIVDNCGEIVLDKLLIKEIRRQFPKARIIAMVRGGAVLNDATIEDAKQVGLTEMVRVIDNGNNIAGTCLEALSVGAAVALDGADVILAKGQANYETLRKCGRNIYYIFMCKCEMFAKGFGVPKFTGMLVNEKNCV